MRCEPALVGAEASNAALFIGSPRDVLAKVKPVAWQPLAFRTAGLAQPTDVTLVPFYQVHRQRYAVYWKLVSVP